MYFKIKMFDRMKDRISHDVVFLSVSGGVSFHSQYSIAYNILHRCLQVSNKTAVLMRSFLSLSQTFMHIVFILAQYW